MIKKMIKMHLTVFLGLSIFTACSDSPVPLPGNKSEKGDWTSTEIYQAEKEVNQLLTRAGFEDNDDKQEICDCIVRRLEVNFPNFEEASFDVNGFGEIMNECSLRYITPSDNSESVEEEDQGGC